MTAHEIDETYAKYLNAYNDQASCIISPYNAFDAFCAEAESNRIHVMTWLKINPKPIYDFIGEKTLSTLQPGPMLSGHIANRFLMIWHGDIQ